MKSDPVIPITAIVTAYDREEITRETVRRLLACDPPPEEILVHLDNGADFEFPEGVRVLRSSENIGPGGGRNWMIREAGNGWVASFDDDSYPLSSDYFTRVAEVIQRHPEVGVIAAEIRHRDPIHDASSFTSEQEAASFIGCGCIYRKEAFLQTDGYIRLPVAYGMEEVDLALQLHAQGISLLAAPDLKVFHDTDLSHHQSAKITAGSIKNQALLAWVRYPFSASFYGLLQWMNKAFDNLKRGRFAGALQGLIGSPLHLWKYRGLRQPVSWAVIKKFRRLSRSIK